MAIKLVTNKYGTDTVWAVELEVESDGIIVKAVNGNNGWNLLKLKNDGTFYRHEYVGEESGFQVDSQGRIKESKQEYVA